MSDETYNGWANRETWAFWLHVTNDEGWYNLVREHVQSELAQANYADWVLGESVVDYAKEALDEGLATPDSEKMMRDEIGSWWRIDHAEIGAAARELAEES
jgi:hypothetical protein